MNNTSNKTSAVAALRILYFALLTGTVLVSVVISVLSMDESPVTDPIENILLIVLAVATAGITVSSLLWRKDVVRIREGNASVKEKFDAYRTAAIKRYAITEFTVLFSVICYYISNEMRLLFVIGLLILHFITLYPSLSKIARDIGESENEIERL